MSLINKLPSIYKTDVNESLFRNIFDKFLTKPALKDVAGVIGSNAPDVLPEFSTYRERSQIQTYLRSRIGTETDLTSFEDVANVLESWGVDLSRFDRWGNLPSHTFYPPIDLDKFNNFTQYFWLNNSTPQYITIKNRYQHLKRYIRRMFQRVPQLESLVGVAIASPTDVNIQAVNDLLPNFFSVYVEYIGYASQDPANNDTPGSWDSSDWDEFIASSGNPLEGWDPALQSLYNAANINQWSATNFWVHVSDIPAGTNTALLKRGSKPIIEYDHHIEINEWSKIERTWKYSAIGSDFALVSTEPSELEILSHNYIQEPISLGIDWFTVTAELGELLSKNQQVTIELTTNGTFLYVPIQSIVFSGPTSTVYVSYDFAGTQPSDLRIHPLRYSSVGDDWVGFTNMWMLTEMLNFVPCEHQEDISEFVEMSAHGISSTIYELPTNFVSKINDIRVYLNGVRQYGNYVEGVWDGVVFTESPIYVMANCIKFDRGVGSGIIRIHVGASVTEDVKYNNVPTRVNGAIKVIPLRTYFKFEQIKTKDNQYPLFNAFDASGKHLNKVTKVWSYLRDDQLNVDSILNDRTSMRFSNDLMDGGALLHVKNVITGELSTCWKLTESHSVYNLDAEPDFCKFNAMHETLQWFDYNYTLSHFNDIITGQNEDWVEVVNPTPILGKIRNYGSNPSWLWSYVHAKLPAIPTVIDSARDRYVSALDTMRKIATDSVRINDFADSTLDVFVDRVVEIFAQDSTWLVYADTTSPIPNFPLTLPVAGLCKPVKPKMVLIDGVASIRHHDGHYSSVSLSLMEIDAIKKSLLKDGIAMFNQITDITGISIGQFLFVKNDLVKLKALTKSIQNPTSALGQGSLWWNSTTQQLWVGTDVGNVQVGLEAAFDLISLNEIIAKVLLNIENTLYESSLDVDQLDFEPLDDERYVFEFASSMGLDPSITTDYNPSNPFTWNYTTTLGAARWYSYYENVYGTRYPNIEPWVLQGYNNKPVWWDQHYKGVGRAWVPQMWINILNGALPVGITASHDIAMYTKIPVNTTNSDVDYPLDALLPPYFDSSDPLLLANRITNVRPTNVEAAMSYVYGDRGPIEDIWFRSFYYPYDVVKYHWRRDPIAMFSAMYGTKMHNGSLNIDTEIENIRNHNQLFMHGDIVDNVVKRYNGFGQWLSHMLRSMSIDYDAMGYRVSIEQSAIQYGYPMSGFVEPQSLSASKRAFGTKNVPMTFDVVIKQSPEKANNDVVTLRCKVFQVGSSEIVNGVRVPTGKGEDWVFAMYAMSPNTTSIKLYEPIDVIESSFTTSTTGNRITWGVKATTTNVIEYKLGTPLDSANDLFIGLEGVIAFINSYERYLTDNGYVFDGEIATLNGTTMGNKLYEFINRVYEGMGSTSSTPFLGHWSHCSVQPGSQTITVMSNISKFKVGQTIQFHTTGRLPSPLSYDEMYVIGSIGMDSITINSMSGNPVTFVNVGQGFLSFGQHRIEVKTVASFFDFNPFVKAVGYNHEIGIFAKIGTNINDTTSIVFDQFGDILKPDDVTVLRYDGRVIIRIKDGVINPKTGRLSEIGGLYPAIVLHEHVTLFDSMSADGLVWFDPSLGAFTSSISLVGKMYRDGLFNPSVPGMFGFGGNMIPNIESAAISHALAYDGTTNMYPELTKSIRKLVGFDGMDNMDVMGIHSDVQFEFYKQMIPYKGLVNTINAYVNSSYFIDAKVDEIWAYKIGDYGTSTPDVFVDVPLIKSTKFGDVRSVDMALSEIRPLNGTSDENINIKLKPITKSLVEYFTSEDALILNRPVNGINCTANVDATTVEFISTGASVHELGNLIKQRYDIRVFVSGIETTNFNHIDGTLHLVIPTGTTVTVKALPRVYIEDVDFIVYYGLGIVLFNPSLYGHPVLVAEMSADVATFSPLRIVDQVDKVSEYVELWDPAIGLHDAESVAVMNNIQSVDPAKYTHSLIASDIMLERNWGDERVETVWWDNSLLAYIPYHERRVYEGDDRIRAWGEMVPFSTIDIKVWTQSSVHPIEYDEQQKSIGNSSRAVTRVLYRTRTSPSDMFESWVHDVPVLVTTSGYEINKNIGPVLQFSPGAYSVYVNGILVLTQDVNQFHTINLNTLLPSVQDWDVVRIMKSPYMPTADDLKFDPDVKDDGRLVQFKIDVPYVERFELNDFNVPIKKYFFWVRNSNVVKKGLTITDMRNRLMNSSRKFAFMSTLTGNAYRNITILGLKPNADQYTLRVVRKDELESTQPIQYTEWRTFRVEQNTNIPRWLWDKVTSSLIGKRVVGDKIGVEVVPSLDLLLHDRQNGTKLQFGLGERQTMAPVNAIKEVLESILLDDSVDLYPIDRLTFIKNYPLDSSDDKIVEMMDVIYKTFSPLIVNTIWFRVAYIGLAENVNYTGLMKTSYIQLHSIQSLTELG